MTHHTWNMNMNMIMKIHMFRFAKHTNLTESSRETVLATSHMRARPETAQPAMEHKSKTTQDVPPRQRISTKCVWRRS